MAVTITGDKHTLEPASMARELGNVRQSVSSSGPVPIGPSIFLSSMYLQVLECCGMFGWLPKRACVHAMQTHISHAQPRPYQHKVCNTQPSYTPSLPPYYMRPQKVCLCFLIYSFVFMIL
jgi:hypothetical protein